MRIGYGFSNGKEPVWRVPADFGAQVVKGLATQGHMIQVDNTKCCIFEHKESRKWYHLCDNGGELNVWEINAPETGEPTTNSIPYEHSIGPVYILTALTMVSRILKTIAGEKIDWEFNFTQDDSDLVCRPARPRGGRH